MPEQTEIIVCLEWPDGETTFGTLKWTLHNPDDGRLILHAEAGKTVSK